MKVPTRALPAAVLVIWAAGAAAGDEPLLQRAKQLYREGRFTEAVHQLSAATTAIEASGDTTARIARLGETYLHLGLCHAALNELTLAKEAFKSLLMLNPGYELDPEIYAPKIIELFEQARLAARAAAPRDVGHGATAAQTPRVLVEGAVGVLRHLSLGSAPTPVFTVSDSEESYQLRLPAATGGAAGAVGLRLASRGDRDRIQGRFAWATLRDSEGVASRALASDYSKELNPAEAGGSDSWRFRALDVLWSRALTTRRSLATRIEVGYRHVRARQATVDLLRDSRCTAISARVCYFNETDQVIYIRRELRHRDSRVADHGLRLAADLDWRLRRGWSVVALAGLAPMTRREEGQTFWEVTDKPEKDPFFRWYEDIPHARRWHLAYDVTVGVRAQLGRRSAALLGSQLQSFGPGSRIASSDQRVFAGLWLRLTYALVR
jgi:hypothetical protein